MASLFATNYLVRQPIELTLRSLCSALPRGAVVYDVGCGRQPYASLFSAHTYVGIDTDPNTSAAVHHHDGEAIPLPTASADFIMCTQTLQHTQHPHQLMAEIYRLLKPGGHALITVPFGIKMVAEPYLRNGALWRDDYWRFTKYGLLMLSEQFSILSLREATGYGGTVLQLFNYALASLNFGRWIAPLYFLNNCLGLILDRSVASLAPLFPRGQFFYDALYCSFTSNYIAILKRP